MEELKIDKFRYYSEKRDEPYPGFFRSYISSPRDELYSSFSLIPIYDDDISDYRKKKLIRYTIMMVSTFVLLALYTAWFEGDSSTGQ